MTKLVENFVENAKQMKNGDYALICMIDTLHQMALKADTSIDKAYYENLASEVLNHVE